ALLLRAAVPVVLVNSEAPRSGLSSIASDNRQGGRLATELVLGLGHRGIAHITAPAANAAATQRLAGARDALRSAGLPPETPRVDRPAPWCRPGHANPDPARHDRLRPPAYRYGMARHPSQPQLIPAHTRMKNTRGVLATNAFKGLSGRCIDGSQCRNGPLNAP